MERRDFGAASAEVRVRSGKLFATLSDLVTMRVEGLGGIAQRFLEGFDTTMPEREREAHGVRVVPCERGRIAEKRGPFVDIVVLYMPAACSLLRAESILPFAEHLALAM